MNKKIPLRQCVGCGLKKSKKELIRVLRSEDGKYMLDATGRMNGRGAYICPNPECFNMARKNKGLERSFEAAISPEVYDSLGEEINKIDKQN